MNNKVYILIYKLKIPNITIDGFAPNSYDILGVFSSEKYLDDFLKRFLNKPENDGFIKVDDSLYKYTSNDETPNRYLIVREIEINEKLVK